jgi:hypothetical protein
MPALSGNAATFRSHAHTQAVGHLSFVPRVVAFSRGINQASFSYPITQLTYDNPYSGAGAYTDIEVGQTIILYSGNTSTVKALLRVAYGGATSTVIQVNEVSRGVADFADNDRFDVVNEYDLLDVLVGATSTFPKDSRRAIVDEQTKPNPICNSGGPVPGYVDTGTSLLTANFYGSTSVALVGGSLTHSWDFGAGATPTSSTAADPAGVTFPVGFRWVEHTVTDTNGKTQKQFVFVNAHNTTTNAPLSVRLNSISGTVADGYYTASFELPSGSQAALSAIPDRCLVVYWEEEYYGNTVVSYGSNVAGRSHIKFVGYLDAESISIESGTSTVTFTALGPLGILEKTGALPQLIISGTTADWQHLANLNVWQAVWYFMYYGSTTMLLHDFVWTDARSFAYARLSVENIDSIKGQVDDVASAINVKATCDRLGRILFTRELAYLTVAERAARTKVYDFTTADLMTAAWDFDHRPEYKLLVAEGITPNASAASQQPVRAKAPGNAPGAGTQTGSLPRQIATLSDLLQRAGDEFARLNGTYWSETTRAITRVPRGAEFTLPGDYSFVDIMLLEPFTAAMAATLNLRGRSFASTELWSATALDMTYDSDTGVRDITLTTDHETHGPPGVNYPLPSQGGIVITTPNFDGLNPGTGVIPLPYTPFPTSGTPPTGKLFALNDVGGYGLATTTGGVTWFKVGSGVLTGINFDVASDTYNYGRKFIATADGLWLAPDPYGTPATASLVANDATLTGTATVHPLQVVLSINRKGFIICPFGNSLHCAIVRLWRDLEPAQRLRRRGRNRQPGGRTA